MENQSEPQTSDQANGQMPAAAPGELATQKRDQDGAMIFLSYFGIFALIPYLTVKDSDFIRWHSKQGLTMAVAMFALGFSAIFIGLIPIVGWIFALLMPLLQLGLLVIDIIAMVKAFGGERWKIPVIAGFADKW